jgi:peptidylprolyl isomerase
MVSLVLAAALAAAPAAPSDEPVAVVDGRAVTAADLRAARDQARARGEPALPAPAVLQRAIDAALLEADGYRAGLARDPEVMVQVETARRRAAADRLVAKELAPAAAPTEAQLREMFHAGADEVDLGLVVVATAGEAAAVRGRLEKGAKLADEARASLNPETQRAEGRLAARRRLDLPPQLAAAAFSGPVGPWQGPLALERGHAVFRVEARRVADEKDLPARRDALLAFGEKRGLSQVKGHYLQQLRARSGVKVDEAFLLATAGRIEGTPAELDHVVAKVGKRAIRYRDVSAELSRLFGPRGGHGTGGKMKIDLAWLLVDQALLEDEALARGHGKAPEVAAAARRAERSAVLTTHVARLTAAVPAPTDAEVERAYQARLGEYGAPGSRRCSHLLLPTRERAADVQRRIVSGEVSLEEAARGESMDEVTAPQGGLIGEVDDRRLEALAAAEPRLAAAIRDARAGEVSAPVQSKAGWHLVRCDAAIAPHPRPLAEVRPEVVSRLRTERADAAVRDRVAALRRAAKIRIDEAALARAGLS